MKGIKLKKATMLSTLMVFFFMASTAYGALSGALTIQGNVADTLAIVVTDATTGDDISNLGVGAGNATVGTITVDANNPNGWKLNIVSANDGEMQLTTGTGLIYEVIAYTMSLTNPSGTLGPNLTPPAVSTLPLASLGTNHDFSGINAGPTVGYGYDVEIDTSAKALTQGTYDDTITFTVSNL